MTRSRGGTRGAAGFFGAAFSPASGLPPLPSPLAAAWPLAWPLSPFGGALACLPCSPFGPLSDFSALPFGAFSSLSAIDLNSRTFGEADLLARFAFADEFEPHAGRLAVLWIGMR